MRTPLFALTLCLVPGLSPGQIGASTVISYTVGTGVSSLYTDPNQALGRPTVDTVLEMDLVPVAPVYAPWLPDELVSVGAGGELILGFDRAIEDDPDNPYGVDLLVFGNSFLSTLSGNDYANHPESTVVGSGLFPEPGRVSVSQDGSNWLAFTSGPFADGMLPTLGRVWTGSAWGGETDPTLPPDPALAPAMLSGMTVA